MEKQTKRSLWTGLALGAALLGGGMLGAGARAEQTDFGWSPTWLSGAAPANAASMARLLVIDDDLRIAGERPVAAGTLDDGEEFLPQAKLTVEQAIRAAQGAASGAIGEIDLESFGGRLVFNVDVGDQDVKVDAVTGEVRGAAAEEYPLPGR
jgi:hypothetical protein